MTRDQVIAAEHVRNVHRDAITKAKPPKRVHLLLALTPQPGPHDTASLLLYREPLATIAEVWR